MQTKLFWNVFSNPCLEVYSTQLDVVSLKGDSALCVQNVITKHVPKSCGIRNLRSLCNEVYSWLWEQIIPIGTESCVVDNLLPGF